MPVNDHEPRTRLQAQIQIDPGRAGRRGAWPPDSEQRNYVDYYQERHLLVRDADIERVMRFVPSAPVEHDNNLRGVTLLRFADDETRTSRRCAPPSTRRSARDGHAGPRLLSARRHLSRHGARGGPGRRAARSGLSTEPCDGHGVLVPSWTAAGWKAPNTLLADGVTGRPRIRSNTPYIQPYAGTGHSWPAWCAPWRPGLMYGCTGRSSSRLGGLEPSPGQREHRRAQAGRGHNLAGLRL